MHAFGLLSLKVSYINSSFGERAKLHTAFCPVLAVSGFAHPNDARDDTHAKDDTVTF